jgi:hypothetical protein
MSKRNITKFLISVQFHHLSIADKQNILLSAAGDHYGADNAEQEAVLLLRLVC